MSHVVVITGASGGIGRASAVAFGARGDTVVLLARGEKGLAAAAQEVEQAGGRAVVMPVDVADAEAVEAVTERIEIPVTTLARIVERHCGGVFPDLLSVDAEGHDLAVLRGIDWARPGPKLICVEANTPLAEAEVLGFLEARGYRRVFAAGPNWLLLRADLAYP
jgi:NAD(P)-dependent dehydrogenase (short-subunit alcohol dehydrogenase family)